VYENYLLTFSFKGNNMSIKGLVDHYKLHAVNPTPKKTSSDICYEKIQIHKNCLLNIRKKRKKNYNQNFNLIIMKYLRYQSEVRL